MKPVYQILCLIACYSSGYLGDVTGQSSKERKMECNLLLLTKAVAPNEMARAEVELKNVSQHDIILKYSTHIFEFLDLEVLDPTGKKISKVPYGGLFSPSAPGSESTLTLRPGASYRETVLVFATCDDNDHQAAGVYKVKATYQHDNQKAISKQVELTVKTK